MKTICAFILILCFTCSLSGQSGALSSRELAPLESSIYYVQVAKISTLNKKLNKRIVKLAFKWSGTGFLTSDGKFITARHVIQPWTYVADPCDPLSILNNYINKRKGVLNIIYKATSSAGVDSFTFTNAKEIFTLNSSEDETQRYKCPKSKTGKRKITATLAKKYDADWIYLQMGNKPSRLIFDRELSNNLDKGETLHLLNYGEGLHLQQGYSTSDLEPLYSHATVAQKGIVNGLITVSNSNFANGSSGGPVFVRRGNEYIVVGLVSARATDQIGLVVPTYNFR